jgi:putative ABC transport system permease protein
MNNFWQDMRYGIRMLAKSPAFTIVAVMTLALGIGANTAIFSVVNAVLIRPLPYKEPERIVMVWEDNRPRSRNQNVVSPANFQDWQEQNSVFEEMVAFIDTPINLTGTDNPEELSAQNVTINMFSMLGVSASIGRTFLPEDGRPESEDVVILSYGLWARRFGSDPGVIGNKISLNANPYTVIGVMPPDFKFFIKQGSLSSKQADVWLPVSFSPQSRVRRGRAWTAAARLKDGVTLEQARSEMNSIAASLEEQYPNFNKNWGVNLVPIHEQLAGEIRPALLVLLGAVGFVLLIACANVANLLLARAAARQKEMAIRSAMGAGRMRIVSQLLTESLLLAGLGGVTGLALAYWGTRLLISMSPKDLLGIDSIGLDYRLLGFTLAVSLITGVIFGLAPAIQASRTNLNNPLKEGGRSAATSGSKRLRNIFVVTEIAMAIVLLVGSGLMIRSVMQLQSVSPGFNPDNLLTVKMLLPGSRYGEAHQRITFFRQTLERVRSLPGVRSASAVSFLPFADLGAATSFLIVGQPEPPPGENHTTDVRVIDPDYFNTMGIQLLRGRTFTDQEATEARHVIIVNESLARNHFPDEDPLGKKLIVHMMNEPVPSEIVGVVKDTKHAGLDKEPRAMVYWPHPELSYSGMALVIRSEQDPLSLAAAVQSEVQSIDRDQPIADIRTMEQLLAASIARSRFSMLLLTVFAAVALLLAGVGIYGVMSYTVTQRTHEMGIRMALGAQGLDVLRLVIGQGMAVALAGVTIGVAGAFALTRLMSSLLFNVSATDPFTFAGIAVLVAVVALLSCYVPARRASRVDPAVALRHE